MLMRLMRSTHLQLPVQLEPKPRLQVQMHLYYRHKANERAELGFATLSLARLGRMLITSEIES